MKNFDKIGKYELGLILNGISKLNSFKEFNDNELNNRIFEKYLAIMNELNLNELNTYLVSSIQLRKYEDNEIYQRVDELLLENEQILNEASFNQICKLVMLIANRCHNSHLWDVLMLKMMETMKQDLTEN